MVALTAALPLTQNLFIDRSHYTKGGSKVLKQNSCFLPPKSIPLSFVNSTSLQGRLGQRLHGRTTETTASLFFFPIPSYLCSQRLHVKQGRAICPLEAAFSGEGRRNQLRRSMPKATISLQESGPLGSQIEERIQKIDHHLSNRYIDLDPAGYFLIRIDRVTNEIIATHFRNTINERGIACDPETGEVIPCDGSYRPQPHRIYRGQTAKELSVKVIEEPEPHERPLTMLDHANYLGREFQKAEFALVSGQDYIQD